MGIEQESEDRQIPFESGLQNDQRKFGTLVDDVNEVGQILGNQEPHTPSLAQLSAEYLAGKITYETYRALETEVIRLNNLRTRPEAGPE